MTNPILELSIRRHPEGRYVVDLHYQPDQSLPTISLPVAGAPTALDPESLIMYQADPEAYGQLLTAQIFAHEPLRRVWQSLRSTQEYSSGALVLRLRIDAAAEPLQQLRWELLSDPATRRPLALEERVRLVRAVAADVRRDTALPERPALRACVIVAQPTDLDLWQLSEIDLDGELGRARAALGDIAIQYIGDQPAQHATRAAIRDALRANPDILYLVGHGAPAQQAGEPAIMLANEDGMADPVAGAAFAADIAQAAALPRLVVLAARRRAGSGYGEALNSIGLQLTRLGVPAVLAFQGDVANGTARQLLATLFAELRRDGQIDRAISVARRALMPSGAWWQAIIWLGGDGQLWRIASPAPVAQGASARALPAVHDQVEGAALRQLLITSFSDSELQDLYFDMNIDFESLPGQSKSDKARELISYTVRHQRVGELMERCQRLRPNADWRQALAAAPPEPPQAAEPSAPAPQRSLEARYDAICQQRDTGSATWQEIEQALGELGRLWPEHPDPAQLHRWVDYQRRRARLGAVYAQLGDPPNLHTALDALESLLEQAPDDLEAARTLASIIEMPDTPLDRRLRAADIAGRFRDLRFPITAEQWRASIAERSDEFGSPPGYWCFVPGGTYSLGSAIHQADEAPVIVSGFWIARYPITVAQYQHFIAQNGYDTAEWWPAQGWEWRQNGQIADRPWGWGDARYTQQNQPVIGIGWDEASAFCRWLQAQLSGAMRSQELRLPTEAEWEVAAARGRDGAWHRYPWGDDPPTIERAIHLSSPPSYHRQGSAPVGCTLEGAAACGALDMAGNIWELVATSWGQYPLESNRLPEPNHSDYIVWRGGAWSSEHFSLICTARDRTRRGSHNLEHGGFRLVLVGKGVA